MNTLQIQNKLKEIFNTIKTDIEFKTFDELNVTTNDNGFVITMPDGTKAHLTLTHIWPK